MLSSSHNPYDVAFVDLYPRDMRKGSLRCLRSVLCEHAYFKDLLAITRDLPGHCTDPLKIHVSCSYTTLQQFLSIIEDEDPSSMLKTISESTLSFWARHKVFGCDGRFSGELKRRVEEARRSLPVAEQERSKQEEHVVVEEACKQALAKLKAERVMDAYASGRVTGGRRNAAANTIDRVDRYMETLAQEHPHIKISATFDATTGMMAVRTNGDGHYALFSRVDSKF